MALIMPTIGKTLAKISSRLIGSILGRWRRDPRHVFSDIYLLISVVSTRLKYIPYSHKVNLVFSSDRMENTWHDIMWQHELLEREPGLLDPNSPEVTRVMRVLARLVQALSDGLRFQHDCTVSAPKYVERGSGDIQGIVSAGKSELVLSGSRWGGFEKTGKLGGLKCNIEHLDGLNWELAVAKSKEYFNASHSPMGRVVLDTWLLDSTGSEEELAFILAHEIGHGVAMHTPAGLDPLKATCLSALNLITWGPAIFLRIWDLILYYSRRSELEADGIGLLLMASAGFDPRRAPDWFEKRKNDDVHMLATTHPCFELRVQMLRRSMDKAMKIYEQFQVSHEVPSFIHGFNFFTGTPAGSNDPTVKQSIHKLVPL
ncbi:mitochondrial metalloendopeptidase oma1 [Phtheirospermum japonicum]|uniref:Mitochondrial metalloendopeptidase oma1 n=1 Tax=Phtheirospermum japonicum TaxID=374723 RepID=A0A830BP59_9LAMI|nr:mitochondrial metalloendopeptidase oma1 [Phtheirospermum japonicum]